MLFQLYVVLQKLEVRFMSLNQHVMVMTDVRGMTKRERLVNKKVIGILFSRI